MMTMTDAKPSRIVGDPIKLDALCPDCFLPALFEITVYRLTTDGITVVARWHGCTDCGHRERLAAP